MRSIMEINENLGQLKKNIHFIRGVFFYSHWEYEKTFKG